MKTAHLIGTILRIRFPYDKDLVNELKNAQYLLEFGGTYQTEVSAKVVQILRKNKFIFSNSLKKWSGISVDLKTESHLPIDFEELKLYPFQKEGVDFIGSSNEMKPRGSGLIADEMGLGKGVQAVSWIKQENIRPVLIICPATLKFQWEREVEKWIGETPQILNGINSHSVTKDIVIINYDILAYWVDELRRISFDTVILDEAHMIKNNQAKRTKAFKKILRTIPNVIALTGTPIESRPVEIYNIVQAINPVIFPNFLYFAKQYCGAKKTRFGWDYSGATNLKELNLILKNSIMIRRKKDEVLKELPAKQIVKIPVQIDNKMEYRKAEEEFVKFIHEKFNKGLDEQLKTELKNYAKRNKIQVSDQFTDFEAQYLIEKKIIGAESAPVLAQIETLKQLAVEGKMKQIIAWIENFLESGEKLVLFAVHRKIVDLLMQKFPTAVKIDGSVSQKQREIAVTRFQKDPNVKLFIGNIKAAGVGITLTAASNAAIIEFPWTPGELNQASDRIHRITQTKQVTIYQIIGVNTIEDYILDLLKKKEKIVDNTLDGKTYQDTSILMDLIQIYKSKIK